MGGMMGGGGGGSFLGTAAAAAAGAVGGGLLLNSIRGMMGGQHHGFGDSSHAAASPWKDESNSNLARDAGINDVGSSHHLAGDQSRDNFSSNDGHDDTDMDSDNFGDDDDMA